MVAPKELYFRPSKQNYRLEMRICSTCKGTALILAVEADGRLCLEECPDCNSCTGLLMAVFGKQ